MSKEKQTPLQAARAAAGQGCAKVGGKLGLSGPSVNRIERGLQEPDINTAADLAEYFRLTIEDVYAPWLSARKRHRKRA